MSLGIPKTISTLYDLLPVPKKAEKVLIKIYYIYLKVYIVFKTWKDYDRKYEAPLYPFKILEIKPSIIKERMKKSASFKKTNYFLPSVKEGNWHNQTLPFEEHYNFKGLKQHFKEDLPFKDTILYKKTVKGVKNQSEIYDYHCDSEKELIKRLNNIDKLYSQIKEQGYLKQSEIKKKNIKVNKSITIDDKLVELNEITVNIGPKGEFIFEDGQHRLGIAKLLELEKVPVRILVRHQEWQKLRDTAVKNPEKLPENFKNHPDIKYLLK